MPPASQTLAWAAKTKNCVLLLRTLFYEWNLGVQFSLVYWGWIFYKLYCPFIQESLVRFLIVLVTSVASLICWISLKCSWARYLESFVISLEQCAKVLFKQVVLDCPRWNLFLKYSLNAYWWRTMLDDDWKGEINMRTANTKFKQLIS